MTSRLSALETKYTPLLLADGPEPNGKVSGYAAVFGEADRSGDVIMRGAFAASLARRTASVKFLWQHDPARPVGVWHDIAEDAHGLRVTGRLLTDIRQGAEAASLLRAGALDGLSIGFRTVRATRKDGQRLISEIELWEISLVTFPMAESARLTPALTEEPALADAIREAARAFAV